MRWMRFEGRQEKRRDEMREMGWRWDEMGEMNCWRKMIDRWKDHHLYQQPS